MNGIAKWIVIAVVASVAILFIAPGSAVASKIREIKSKVGL